MSEKQQLLIQNQSEKENKIIEYDNIKYLINEEENTSGVIGCEKDLQQIHIPRSIKQGTKEFNITHIMENAFKSSKIESIRFSSDSKLEIIDKNAFSSTKIKSIIIPSSVTLIGEGAFYCCRQLEVIEIPNDSKLQTIDKYAFYFTRIKRITIPSELVDLKEGWCFGTSNLTEIIVSPNNPKYCLYEDNMILGKTRKEENNYENLIFCCRNIKHIKIPNFIKHICSYSFGFCNQLETIEISNDSKLQTIDKYAFYFTTIKRITIPSELVDLKEGWCFGTSNLTEIIVSPNNPKYCLYEENMILGKTNNESNNYENLIFCCRNIKHIKIPNFIKHICSYSFEFCNQLETIEISNDSKLQTIDKYAFYFTTIKRITIPSELVDLKEGWCFGTSNLTEIIVSPNNPKYCLYEDNMILGKTNNESNNYENLIFCCRNIKHIKIPNFIKHICSYSFDYCNQLETIEISFKSKLERIDKYAFSFSTIKSIRIPSSVTLIGERAFSFCNQLEVIEIPNDSKLQTIDKEAFSYSTIKSIIIPSSLTLIGEGAFSNCYQLQIIEINNKEMISMCQSHFKYCVNAILMIPVDF